MKIRMNEMTPEGKIQDRGEIFAANTSAEIVQSMMAQNPFANDQTEAAFMRATLDRVGETGFVLPNALNRATKAFLDRLQEIGLASNLPNPERSPASLSSCSVAMGTPLGAVRRVLREGGYSPAFIDTFVQEATAGDYDHLLATVMRYVEVK